MIKKWKGMSHLWVTFRRPVDRHLPEVFPRGWGRFRPSVGHQVDLSFFFHQQNLAHLEGKSTRNRVFYCETEGKTREMGRDSRGYFRDRKLLFTGWLTKRHPYNWIQNGTREILLVNSKNREKDAAPSPRTSTGQRVLSEQSHLPDRNIWEHLEVSPSINRN